MMIMNMNDTCAEDQTPMQHITEWPAIITIVVVLAIVSIMLSAEKLYCLVRDYYSSESEDSQSTQSSNSTTTTTSALEPLDSIAPPRTFKQVVTELEPRSPGGRSIWMDSLNICAICLVKIEDRDIVRSLPCGHGFHSSCIASWYLRHHCTCPLCLSCFMPSEARCQM
ncbi:hypothetical protein BKA56DRAFT_604517 [Ilyonectria sp. MPI-CAGE-AT-0026]|nr:hypothetical protein BKA56DRAFT_604517 [Ilyonectria sp. MPI-CAGE-AT-0026]